MRETTKSNKRRDNTKLWDNVFSGDVLDIGCGDDPLKVGDFNIKTVRTFDVHDGDANNITRHIRSQFDCVYGSQVLEHMWNPPGTLFQWWSLVREGGYLAITIPDFELYEKTDWPSRYNTDHKWAFSLDPDPGWVHINKVINPKHMFMMLPNSSLKVCKKIDTNYDYEKLDEDQTLGDAEAWIEIVSKKVM